jgi:cobalt/nickel transport system permease protein
MFAEVFALVFIRSYERSERVHKAMIARGFSGSYGTVTTIPALRKSEYLLICAGAAVVLAIALTTPSLGG